MFSHGKRNSRCRNEARYKIEEQEQGPEEKKARRREMAGEPESELNINEVFWGETFARFRLRLDCAAPCDEVDDEYHDRNHQQQVDEATRNMQAESQEPEDNEDDEDCPEHGRFPFYERHPEGRCHSGCLNSALKQSGF